MSGKWTFNEERPSENSGRRRESEGNAEVSQLIEKLYSQLLEFDLTYDQLYEMTVKELIDTLIGRRKGIGYNFWKQAYLISWAVAGKHYPKTPEKASPELYPKKPTIKMPSNLLKKHLNNTIGEKIYE